MKWSHSHKGITKYQLILLVILLLGAGIRLYRINYDLPYVYDQDEPMFVTRSLSMLKNYDPNPHWFGPPASTTMYLLAITYAAIFAGGRLGGIFHDAADFRNLYYSDPSVFYLSGRIWSVFFGVASIWLVYKIGRRLFGPAAGLIAAAILAVSPTHIFLSQQVRMDVQMTFLVLSAFWFCLNIIKQQDWRSYLLAGFLTGLAIVTKYPAAVFTLTIALAHFSTAPMWRLAPHRKLLGSAAACFAGMFAGSPFVFVDFRTVLKDVVQEARPEHLTATGEGLVRNLLWYVQGPLPAAVSIVGLVLVGIGILFCLTSKDRGRRVLASSPILFLVFISFLSLRWERWILPAVPFLGLLVGFAMTHLAKLLAERFNRRWVLVTTILLCLAVFSPLLRSSVTQAREMGSPYTSSLVRQWMILHIPKGSRVLVEVYGPRLPASDFKVLVVDEVGKLSDANLLGSNYDPGWEIGRVKNVGDIATQHIQYFVMTGYYQHFLNERERYPREVETYEQVMSLGKLIYDLQSAPGVSRGPRVRVYQLHQK